MVVTIDPKVWHKAAAISGVAALGLGTYGFHVFSPQNPSFKEVWHTAALYHLVHTAALVGAPITKFPNIGLYRENEEAMFSVTLEERCYMAAYFEDKNYSFPAPFGGFAFVAAWASLLF
ncbi:hypothetical protein C4D60_Mb06t35690 [Musa balbisiana]|uniref:Uncharacterized protein n=1 Tax=Musa balbisiana TaxID=52838 RepID=A0A4S8IT05_MUSBA|nr:hypothetical protein C4D60_Mb06t35690 [Musa balbisiana]